VERTELQTIVEALAGPNPLGCAVKENGVLVIVDSSGKKKAYYPADYQHLLHPRKTNKTTKGDGYARAQ